MPYFLRAAMCATVLVSSAPAHAQTLTLDDAIARAISASPMGEAAAARADALIASRAAADTRPAASIDVLAENFGIGDSDLYRQFQIGAMYSQRIERGDKRAARVALADAELEVAAAEAFVRRLDIASTVQRLYVEVQATEATIDIAKARVEIAEQLSREVGRRVSEARDPLFAGTRARTQLAEARVDLELAEHARDAAMKRLVALWDGDMTGLSVSREDFLRFAPVDAGVPQSAADLAVYEARQRRASADITLQQAGARTDPTVSAGPRYIGTGDVALVAGVSLPLANRALNQANIARAEAATRQAQADLAVERYQRRQAIMLAAEKVEETAHEVEAIRDQVVPGALKTLAEVRAGYNRGGFTFLDVSMAQVALHDARARMVRVAILHHQARVELDRLTGRFAPLLQGAE
ncbi:outer membrane efflux family protein (plasmid) [Blastomonas sp. RAC04]|uniref:TolC family protein n=1 Tax=Blastomonas sp. RAC04 TaxID=1842535 RepID=UPI00083DCE3C|nr:TolC family protein [Blastomonas sp. RAC04]AOF98678.1 outer membrane efflux family protein [Blastomonas sp. RAC04]